MLIKFVVTFIHDDIKMVIKSNLMRIGLWLWCVTPLSTIFQLYIVAVSFIGGGNRSIRRKPQTSRKLTDKLYPLLIGSTCIMNHDVSS